MSVTTGRATSSIRDEIKDSTGQKDSASSSGSQFRHPASFVHSGVTNEQYRNHGEFSLVFISLT